MLHFYCAVLTYQISVNATTNAFLSGASIYIQTRKRREERQRDESEKITKNYSFESRGVERQEGECGVGDFIMHFLSRPNNETRDLSGE